MQDESKRLTLESGIEIDPVYTPQHVTALDYRRDIGPPGEYPFTRGIHPLMYRSRAWTMRQYAGFGTPKQTNQRFKVLISHGQNALNVAFDLPTQMGLDSDDPLAEGEVGRVGMAVDTLLDMEEAFDEIPIERISTSLTINAPAIILFAMYLALAERRGIPFEQLRGNIQNDILKELIGRGAWIFPVEESIRLVIDIMEYCARRLKRYTSVSVCGYHLRESGATPNQEVGYAFEIAKAYADRMLARGLDIDQFGHQITFNFNVFGNLWEQVAKFRAGRRKWAKIIKEQYGARDPRAMQLRMIAGGGGSGLTIEEPENNIIRGAYYALAGALGGTQTMALCCYDEAYTIPSQKASLLSLRTMQILAEEIGLCDTVDPLAGSYFIEWLTDRMEDKIEEAMQEVTSMGGIVRAISEGDIQRKLARQAYEYERKVREGKIVKVGVNKYVDPQARLPQDLKLHRYDRQEVGHQIKRLRQVRAQRDSSKTQGLLDGIKRAIEQGQNLVEPVLKAVKGYATLGEITRVFKEMFGEFKEPRVV
jgi:methylmalonyl-CoA mutase N-terminal domain/subunit